MMPLVDVISSHPVKAPSPRTGATLNEPCCKGGIVSVPVPSSAPAELKALTVATADAVGDGLAYATPVAVCANVTNFVAGGVSGLTASSPEIVGGEV